ncbi:hypothetical protein ACXR2U_23490, partial [Jatrophihabitans sp. YIM 134969]
MSARSRSVLLTAAVVSTAVAGALVGVSTPAVAAAPAALDLTAHVTPKLAGFHHVSGPLTPRLSTLATAAKASTGAQAAAVGLPLTGPGSLRRDAAGRVLVDVLVRDASGY